MIHGCARLATACAIAALLLGLTACTGDDGEDGDDGTSSQPPADGGAKADAGGTEATGGADFETAAETALGEVDGTVVEVGREPDAWDAVVITEDGSEHEVELSADAASVTRHRVETAEDDPDDAAERRRLLGAQTDLATAIEAALSEVDGALSSVELSEDDGVVTWEVELDAETADQATVAIDAQTGEVLGVERGE